jgi:hypothetical protein
MGEAGRMDGWARRHDNSVVGETVLCTRTHRVRRQHGGWRQALTRDVAGPQDCGHHGRWDMCNEIGSGAMHTNPRLRWKGPQITIFEECVSVSGDEASTLLVLLY